MKIDERLYIEIKTLVEQARNSIVRSVNWAMVVAHWEIRSEEHTSELQSPC